MVDNFSANPVEMFVKAPGTLSITQTGISTSNTIGGSRILSLTVLGRQTDSIVVDTSYKDLSMNIGSGDQGTGIIRYDNNSTSLGEHFYDLLGGGANAATSYFRAIVKFSDHQLQFTTTFTDSANHNAAFTSSLPQGSSVILQSFASFSNSAAVNFNDIKSITIRLDGPQAQDVTIGLLEVTDEVPEPRTMALFGSALAGLGLIRRKRNRP